MLYFFSNDNKAEIKEFASRSFLTSRKKCHIPSLKIPVNSIIYPCILQAMLAVLSPISNLKILSSGELTDNTSVHEYFMAI